MKKSFTLIETLTVLTIIALTIPTIFYIILTLLRQQVKIFRISQVKREGDYLITIMENLIRNNAVSIHAGLPASDANLICNVIETSPSGSNLYFLDKFNKWFGFELNGNTISSNSANLATPLNLNSSKTLVNNFSIYCSKTADHSASTVLFSFDICFQNSTGVCTSSRPEETASLRYQTRIKIRNF